jgi:hypothetical protein
MEENVYQLDMFGSSRDDIGWYPTLREEAHMIYKVLQIPTFWLNNALFRLGFIRIVAPKVAGLSPSCASSGGLLRPEE